MTRNPNTLWSSARDKEDLSAIRERIKDPISLGYGIYYQPNRGGAAFAAERQGRRIQSYG